jgi:glycosyltransferase involved in cell wall biosynthesis
MSVSAIPRVALFADSFHEVNGVALTARMLEDFARRRSYPMLSVHTGGAVGLSSHGSIQRFELKMSPLSFGLERDLRFDAAFLRHYLPLRRAVLAFRPDLVHFTGPSHTGILGALLAWRLKIPIVASWHTNVHEYAGSRLVYRLRWLPQPVTRSLSAWAERGSLWAAARFYSNARLTLAPNPELIAMLEQRTGKACRLMRRGVDVDLYSPARRSRNDQALVIGYVGRLSPEKNVRLLASVEQALLQAGLSGFRIEIAGHGGERPWLRANVLSLLDHDVLRGESLARAYAGFDIFAFPSETDTYGNVVQEAMASGVPCVVTSRGGPAHIVTDGHDGFVTATPQAFLDAVLRLARDAELRRTMAANARATALRASWDSVFEDVYRAYADSLSS